MARKSRQKSTKLPKLTEAHVIKMATPKSFDRGQRYYRNAAITDATRQDNRIWADCYGSELYQTSATLNASGVAESFCTCPYDWGGICKHRVALLLTYVYEPQSFRVIPPLREMLADYSRDDLFNLLDRILQQQPDLITNLEITAELNTPHETGKPVDTSGIRRQIKRALRGDEMWTIVNQLKPVLKLTEQLYESQDYLNAGRFYAVLLEEITEQYDYEIQATDYDGYVAGYSQDAAEGIHNCLIVGEINDETRDTWFSVLLAGFLKDMELGGMDFAAGADDALISQTSDAEWDVIEGQIRQAIAQGADRWERDAMTRLITRRLEHIGQNEAAADTDLELSSPERRVFILLERGEYTLAIELAKQHLSPYPGLVMQFADALIAAGQRKPVLLYMQEIAVREDSYHYRQWLGKYYREHHNYKSAWEFELANFMLRPSLAQYQVLAYLAQSIGNWEKQRKMLLKQLRDNKQWLMLIDIAIYEKDLEQALKLQKKLPQWSQHQANFKIAKLAETADHALAISIYEAEVHRYIANKNRSAYQSAVEYLRLIQKLKRTTSTAKTWQTYIQAIRDQYPTLRALHDELRHI